jgi:DNA-binding response OmpR family regulator
MVFYVRAPAQPALKAGEAVGNWRRNVGSTRTLDAHACRLHNKLRPSSRPWIVNVRGVGYKLTEAL